MSATTKHFLIAHGWRLRNKLCKTCANSMQNPLHAHPAIYNQKRLAAVTQVSQAGAGFA